MNDFRYRSATRDELEIAFNWAADEGWNPGVDDASIFWDTDPEGYVVIERENQVIGTGSIVSYGEFGFMGFFIVRGGLRNQGIGGPFWHWRKERLQKRLNPGAAIGMDGVFDMQAFYARGGFVFTHRNLRMEGIAKPAKRDSRLLELQSIDFEAISKLDRSHFGFDRPRFLKRWTTPIAGLALGFYEAGRLFGYGVVRKCLEGYKIGPLFADSPEIAEAIFNGLSDHVAGSKLYLDTPENNPAALALAAKYEMTEVFGCARMYAGPAPQLRWRNIYGITTFELG